MRRKQLTGGIVAFVGFILSPLSWWNDLFVNIPIAYGVAYLFGLMSKSLFFPMFLAAYLLTNVAGFIMMQNGIEQIAKKRAKHGFLESLAVSVFYMIIVVVLMLYQIIPLPKVQGG